MTPWLARHGLELLLAAFAVWSWLAWLYWWVRAGASVRPALSGDHVGAWHITYQVNGHSFTIDLVIEWGEPTMDQVSRRFLKYLQQQFDGRTITAENGEWAARIVAVNIASEDKVTR